MPIPETYLNSVGRVREWRYIDANGQYNLWEAYLNGHVVYRKALELFLPDPQGVNNTINLRAFINANNPDGYQSISIINNFIQPKIITGDLTGLEVELINNGEILGNASGADALVISSNIIVTNNGWIKGAGGAGGAGGDGTTSSRLSGTWLPRGHYDDPRYDIGGVIHTGYSAGHSGILCGSGTYSFFNRFWKTSGGTNSGAWVQTGCTNQRYWNTTTDVYTWGDQGSCHKVYGGDKFPVRHGSGIGLQVCSEVYQYHNGGAGGAGGAGQQFLLQSGSSIGLAGATGTITGPNPGFNPATSGVNAGKNYTDNAAILATLDGGAGGAGGAWGAPGSVGGTSSGGTTGSLGQQPGNAITGSSLLLPGSVTGNVIGNII
jgi:hypothetical protein